MKLKKSEIASIKIARANRVNKWERFQIGPGMINEDDARGEYSFEPINLEERFKALKTAREDYKAKKSSDTIAWYGITMLHLKMGDVPTMRRLLNAP